MPLLRAHYTRFRRVGRACTLRTGREDGIWRRCVACSTISARLLRYGIGDGASWSSTFHSRGLSAISVSRAPAMLPDEGRGEMPKAFVVVKSAATPDELMELLLEESVLQEGGQTCHR